MYRNKGTSGIKTLQANLWWRAYLDDPFYGSFQLKRLKNGMPSYCDILMSMIPGVELEEFREIESDRLPLFAGSQFGIFPRLEDVFNDTKERTVVILNFSMLSGCMAGVSIYKTRGPKAIKKLNTIEFPNHIKMAEILPIPFPEVLQIKFGFKGQPSVFSGMAEIARTPVQHFQNMCYREESGAGARKLDRAKNMLLVNEFNGMVPMYFLSKDRPFELGYFEFDAQYHFKSCGLLPAMESIGIGQSVRSFTVAYILLTPVETYTNFRKRFHGPADWEGIRMSIEHPEVR